MLTEDDDLIRAHDTPERMQLATSSLSLSGTLTLQSPHTEADLDDASVSGVLISVLQKDPIDQYTRSAKEPMASGPLKMAFSYISRPLVLQIRFSKTYLGEIKHIPIWQVVPMGAFLRSYV